MKQIFLLALITLLSTACSSFESKVYQLDLAKNCQWQSASVIKKHTAAELAATDMGPEWREAFDNYRLELATVNNFFTIHLSGKLGSLYSSRNKDYDLRVAQDCHGAGLSADNGQYYYYLALDAKKPFICLHNAISAGQDLPKTADIVVNILQAPENHKDLNSVVNKDREAKAAFFYALENKKQKSLRWAAIDFLGKYDKASHEIISQGKILLEQFPDLKTFVFEQAEHGVDSYLKMLAYLPESNYQENFADWLATELKKEPSKKGCDRIYHFSKALLLKTALLKSGGRKIVDVLATLAKDPRCPLLKDAPNPYDHEVWSIRGQNARIWAIKALALINTSDSKAVLQHWAKQDCKKYRRIKKQIVLEPDPYFFYKINPDFKNILHNDHKVNSHQRPTLSCFAQSGVKMLQQ